MPSWTTPEIPVGTGGATDERERSYGPDIYAGPRGPEVGPHGDWTVVTGVAAARQSVRREAVANPGELASVPAWGMGLPAAVMSRRTRGAADDLRAVIAERLRANPRLTRVRSISVERVTDGIDVKIAADVGGRDEQVAFLVTGGSTP